jgi:hypothetical protein
MYVRVAIVLLLLVIMVVAYKFDTIYEHYDNEHYNNEYYIDDIATSRYSTERVIKQSSPDEDNPDNVVVVDIERNKDNKDKSDKSTPHKTILKRDYNSYDSAWSSESSELSERFFSDSNIDYLLDKLRKEVYNYTERVNGTPIDIGLQPRKDFICIMMSALAIHRQHIDSRLHIDTQLSMLNNEFIDRITPKIAGQTVSHLRFLNDISKPYTLVDIPESTRLNSKELRLFSF